MWIILAVIAGIVLFLYISKSGSGRTGGTTKKSDLQPPANPGRKLNPTDMYDICYALGCLASSIGGSTVSVILQNKDTSKGWNADVIISAFLDTGSESYYKTNKLNTMEEMEKFFMPADIARFLINIPFEVDNCGRSTDLRIRPMGFGDYPARGSTCDLLAKELENGYSASVTARIHSTRHEVEKSKNNNHVELRTH